MAAGTNTLPERSGLVDKPNLGPAIRVIMCSIIQNVKEKQAIDYKNYFERFISATCILRLFIGQDIATAGYITIFNKKNWFTLSNISLNFSD